MSTIIFGKKEVKDLGLSVEQSRIVIQNTYTSELLADNNYINVAKDAFKGNADGFSVVNKLAADVAKLNYRVFRVNKTDGKKTYLNTHPFLELIKKPNVDEGKYEYMYRLVMYFLLAGQTFQQRVLVAGEPTALYSPFPNTIGFHLEGGKQTGWYFDYNGRKVYYKKDEISQLKVPDPLDPYRGFSPLRAAAYEIDGNNESNMWNYSMIKNGARPSGILTTEQKLQDTAIKRLKALLKGWSGNKGAGESKVLDGGVKWQQMSVTSKDMDGLEYSKLNSRRIAQVLQIPGQVMGFPEAATFANFAEANKYYAENTLLNMAQRIVDEWNLWLMPLYGDNVFIEIKTSDIEALQENRNDLSKRTIEEYDSGIITRGESRQVLGYDEDEDDNVYKLKTSEVFYNKDTKTFVIPQLGIEDSTEDDAAKSIDNIFAEIKSNLIELELKKKEKTLDDEEILAVLAALDYQEVFETVESTYIEVLESEGERAFVDQLELEGYETSVEAQEYLEALPGIIEIIVDSTLKGKVETRLIEGSEKGENVSQIKERVEELFEDQYFIREEGNHLDNISNTESLGTTSTARFDAYIVSGIVEATEWITTLDGNERAWHNSLNGQTKTLGENYISGLGNELRYPRDWKAPAEERANCRCGEAPIITENKAKYDSLEKKEELWKAQDEEAMKWIPVFKEIYDKAFRKQMDNVLDALDNI